MNGTEIYAAAHSEYRSCDVSLVVAWGLVCRKCCVAVQSNALEFALSSNPSPKLKIFAIDELPIFPW